MMKTKMLLKVLTFSEDRVSEVLSLKPNEDKDTPEVLSLKDGEEEDTGASAFFGGTGATGIEGTEPEPTTILQSQSHQQHLQSHQ